VWLFLAIIGLVFLSVWETIAKKNRERLTAKCIHGNRGECRICKLESEKATRDRLDQARVAIEQQYWLIPETIRNNLRQRAEALIQKEFLLPRPGPSNVLS
jgi:hypothetical protein